MKVRYPTAPGATRAIRWDVLMNRKLIVAILLVVAVPVAQAQNPRVSKADAQKVVTIISGKLRPKPIAKYRNSVSRQSRPTRRKTTKWPMNCPRNAA